MPVPHEFVNNPGPEHNCQAVKKDSKRHQHSLTEVTVFRPHHGNYSVL